MDGMVGFVARRDDVMARDLRARPRVRIPSGADVFVRSYYEHLGDDDLATWSTDELARAALEHWRFGAHRAPGRDARARLHARARPHRDRRRDRRHALPRRLAHDGARPPQSRRAPRRAPDPARRAAPPTASCGAWRRRRRRPRRRRDAPARVVDAHRGRPGDERRHPRDRPRRARSPCSTTCGRPRRDWQPMLDALHRVADELERSPPPCPSEELAEGKALLRWLADEQLHVPRLPRRTTSPPTTRCCPVAGQRARPVARRARKAVDELREPARRGPRQGAREDAAGADQGQRPRRRCTGPTHLDYIGIKRFDASGDGGRRAPLHRPVRVGRVHCAARSRCRCCGARSRPSSSGPGSCPRATTRRISCRSSRRTRATTCSRSTSTISSRSRWASCACRSGGGCACSCTASRSAGSCRASSSSLATATRPQVRERIAQLGSSTRTASDGYEWNTRLSESALARLHYVLHLDRRRRPAPSTRRALERSVATAARGVGRRPPRRADRRRRARRRASTCSGCGATRSRPRTATTSTRPRRSPTSPSSNASATHEPLAARLTIGAEPSRPQAVRHRRATVAVGGAAPPHEPGRHRRRRAPLRDHAQGRRPALDEVVPPARARRRRSSTPRRCACSRRRSSRSSTAAPRTTASTGSC